MNQLVDYKTNAELPYTTVATIDLGAIIANYKILAQHIAPAECSAVVKANAYGMGAEKISSALYQAGCRTFFVSQIQEALQLKTILPSNITLVLLNGFPPTTEEFVAQAGLIPVLNSWHAIESWQMLCQKKHQKFPAIIQIDTHMNRLGLDQEELQQLIKQPTIFEKANIKYIMSHLSNGDDATHASNDTQLTAMKTALAQLPTCKVSLANSGGIFLNSDFYFDLVRPGIALYGVDPHGKCPTPIKPVLKLETQVIQSRHVDAGTPVGYGGSFVTSRPSTLTTISIGYADGWLRTLSNKGVVYFNGHKLPIIGRISMDSTIVDATDLECEKPKIGDWVELIGPHQTVEDVAADADTIPYEILTSLGPRCKRIYI
ncbi:alanine racemase [Bartonella bacilliformis Peru38]|uniref:Alanine racemase n=2 Tax=Bartonella bacilliformis TaxID=774 RepID=A1UTQ2_BARBK|nr:alanine racemase [Bartonella bacilliformis]ABM45232.1 alanine racemase [Bartonella bacilliformis KC583]AMG86108.1 alanine racemase [Bartonella bacilliformis]EKS43613.1 alanine racemase [Bartonella bacilliformis INS]EYS88668.1 alanine racemase [Bartonella bacilliformis San Pedro600-02]KEG19747.1 alanine racemase [Bartonella bacilliformis Peru38]